MIKCMKKSDKSAVFSGHQHNILLIFHQFTWIKHHFMQLIIMHSAARLFGRLAFCLFGQFDWVLRFVIAFAYFGIELIVFDGRLLLFTEDGAECKFGVVDMEIKILVGCEIEGFLDVISCLCTHFKIRQTNFLDFAPYLLSLNLSVIFKVEFIAHQDHNGLFFFVILAEIDPFIQVLKRSLAFVIA